MEIVDNEDYKHFQIDFEASEVIFETTFDDDGKLLSSQSKHKFDKNYSCKIIAHIIAKHKDIIEEYEDDIKALKSLRDTKIAHSDKKTISLEKTTWDKLDKLSVYVIEYLDIIEHVFLAASRSLSSDAKRNGHSLKRMLLELNDIC
ncbi:hypothetical protein CVO_04705 [Sulfurimonas sp. CVO]|nr:hypothetical protein CVO_04705 [Sulfurimonas sp. CVO]